VPSGDHHAGQAPPAAPKRPTRPGWPPPRAPRGLPKRQARPSRRASTITWLRPHPRRRRPRRARLWLRRPRRTTPSERRRRRTAPTRPMGLPRIKRGGHEGAASANRPLRQSPRVDQGGYPKECTNGTQAHTLQRIHRERTREKKIYISEDSKKTQRERSHRINKNTTKIHKENE
jgi:hypothetical protein